MRSEKHEDPSSATVGDVAGKALPACVSAWQQHDEERLMEQYPRTVVKPVEVSATTAIRKLPTAVWKGFFFTTRVFNEGTKEFVPFICYHCKVWILRHRSKSDAALKRERTVIRQLSR